MLRHILKLFRQATPPRLFLGEVAVVPKSNFDRILDEISRNPFSSQSDMDLRACINKWLEIPQLYGTAEIENAIIVDIYVCAYRNGHGLWGSIGDLPISIFWRPCVEIRARTSHATSRNVISTFSKRTKMPWRMFLNRLFSVRSLLLGRGVASDAEMQAILGETLLNLMKDIRSAQ